MSTRKFPIFGTIEAGEGYDADRDYHGHSVRLTLILDELDSLEAFSEFDQAANVFSQWEHVIDQAVESLKTAVATDHEAVREYFDLHREAFLPDELKELTGSESPSNEQLASMLRPTALWLVNDGNRDPDEGFAAIDFNTLPERNDKVLTVSIASDGSIAGNWSVES